jgi:FkbH-like protein
MSQSGEQLVIASSFTADPIADAVTFWMDYLHTPARTVLAPYAQIYQELHDPTRELRCNQKGANVICLRWVDLCGDDKSADGYLAAAEEFAGAICQAGTSLPLAIVLCPEEGKDTSVAESAFAEKVSDLANLSLLDAREAFERYAVAAPFDAAAESAGHIPYTTDGMVAIGTAISRWWMAHSRKPMKVFASDCDHTLWQGVVGEDGANGINLTSAHLALQQKLADQTEAGRLVCLLSKNEEQDVQQVFATRQDMVLDMNDITAHRINWQPKRDNVAELMADLNLGFDSAVFLDDSSVEIAEMRSFRPEVISVQIPKDEQELARFVDHLWLFDAAAGTEEDRQRGQMYKENAARGAAQKASASIEDFISSLNLEVEIDALTAQTLPRFSQLTQRTNQFNATMQRLTESEVMQAQADGAVAWTVSARDRFGDYGIVGAMLARPEGTALKADVFLLSCRALGRGIEHQMVQALGRHAASLGLAQIVVPFRKAERNTPVAQFLKSLSGGAERFEADADLVLSASAASEAVFKAGEVAEPEAVPVASPKTISEIDYGVLYQEIATRFTTAAAINDAITGELQERPALQTGFIAPASGLESQIAKIWEKVLRIQPIGAQDAFKELDGKSIQLVQIHGLLKRRLGLEIDLTLLFEHATVASLAARLQNLEQGTGNSSKARADKMRAARQQARHRRKPARQGNERASA